MRRWCIGGSLGGVPWMRIVDGVNYFVFDDVDDCVCGELLH